MNKKKIHVDSLENYNVMGLSGIHWVIVALSVGLTLFAWRYSEAQNEKRLRLKFDTEVQRISGLVKERLELYESGLKGGVAAIRLNGDKINNSEWKKFSKELNIDKKYPGISGIGVIFRVRPDELENHLQVERLARPDYKVHPKHSNNEFWPITYIEPVSTNAKAVGLDMAFEKNRFTAAKKAMDTGSAQITGPIILVQDSEKLPGFLFYSPFYKNQSYENSKERVENFIGLVYAPFIVKRLMEGTLQKSSRHIHFNISDSGTPIYEELNKSVPGFDEKPVYRTKTSVELYGRTWQFDVQTSLSFRNYSKSNQSVFILIFGIIIDSLLFLFFVILSNSKNQAVSYANKVTRELRQTNEELQQFAYRTSHDLVSPLKSISGVVEYAIEDLESKDYKEVEAHMGRISGLTNRLIGLVNDILNLTKADNVRDPVELIDFKEVEESILGRLTILIKELNVDIVFDVKTHEDIYTQKTRLIQVLENLISNGIKYRNTGRDKPSIRVLVEMIDAKLRVQVIDNGIGIPEKFHDQTFEMFKRFSPKSSDGSGLGLYLVKKHIDFLDGEITFTSNQEGTTFIFTIPNES